MTQQQNTQPAHQQSLEQDQQLLFRLQRISDGIFMLAMMLMVLQFDLPDIKG